MKPGKGSAGVHRVKRNVDRLWLKHELDRREMTLASFATALAKETGRDAPLDKASIHRRIQGKIPFTALEAEAMARMFATPVETILAKIGGAASEPPVIGTIDAAGSVDVRASPSRSDQQLRLTMETRDGWDGATVYAAVRSTPVQDARRGLYLARLTNGETRMLQVIGAIGSAVVTASPHGEMTNNLQGYEIKALCRIVKIEFPI